MFNCCIPKHDRGYLSLMWIVGKLLLLQVFIDFTKAFDSISHSLLLRKLHTIGVVDTALCFSRIVFQTGAKELSSMATPLVGCNV